MPPSLPLPLGGELLSFRCHPPSGGPRRASSSGWRPPTAWRRPLRLPWPSWRRRRALFGSGRSGWATSSSGARSRRAASRAPARPRLPRETPAGSKLGATTGLAGRGTGPAGRRAALHQLTGRTSASSLRALLARLTRPASGRPMATRPPRLAFPRARQAPAPPARAGRPRPGPFPPQRSTPVSRARLAAPVACACSPAAPTARAMQPDSHPPPAGRGLAARPCRACRWRDPARWAPRRLSPGTAPPRAPRPAPQPPWGAAPPLAALRLPPLAGSATTTEAAPGSLAA
mmetsp:Transcript_18062/g.68214  ORF Transcript_18062/g.68214 Transcript_18062/m.68214 type:complete len:288 (-) Transcript_18062:1460-2323(-)